MRFAALSSSSCCAWAITFLLLGNTRHVRGAGWANGMSKKDKKKLQDIVSGTLDMPDDLELFVKYKNIKGEKFAQGCAKKNKVDKRLRKQMVLSLHANNGTALKKMVENPDIEYIEINHKLEAISLRKQHSQLQVGELNRRLEEVVGYGVKMVQADDLVWGSPPAGGPITICVIDSGYGLGHPDLPNDSSYGVTGYSAVKDDWFVDASGHGTHCSGIIGSVGNNNKGVVGVLGDPTRFKFHIGKAIDDDGIGTEGTAIEALQSCIDEGARVVSMSIGADGKSQTSLKAFKDAYDEGLLLVASAGNYGDSSYNFPASYSTVMSVAAVNKDEKWAFFSQYNDQVEIAAPGVGINSTITRNSGQDFGYASWSGTSMAAPYVAGVAALVWSYFPDCTNNQIRNVLIRTAKENGDYIACSQQIGFGIVQAKAAYDLLKDKGCEAGGASPSPLSDGAVGGCSQDPEYVPPPTMAPTACIENIFLLKLDIDKNGYETSWILKNSEGHPMVAKSNYEASRSYEEELCLPDDVYTFTIVDDNGLCCDGGYIVYYNGEMIKSGGEFSGKESFTFGGDVQNTLPPTPSPTTNEECQDDETWVTVGKGGKEEHCDWVSENTNKRCRKKGIDTEGKESDGFTACPKACGRCPAPTASTPQPSLSPTPETTPSPSPTSKPTEATPGPTPACGDNPTWTFKRGKKEKSCLFLRKRPSYCGKDGKDESGAMSNGYISCPFSCGEC